MTDHCTDTDPFTQCYSFIWELLNEQLDFVDLVKPKNMIRLDDNPRNPFKETVRAADLPQVTLLPTDGDANLGQNSNETRLGQNFTLAIVSGDLRIGVYFPIKFAVCRALASWKQKTGVLFWHGRGDFLQDLNISSSTDTISEFDEAGNVISWDGLLTITAQLWFPTSLLTLKDQ